MSIENCTSEGCNGCESISIDETTNEMYHKAKSEGIATAWDRMEDQKSRCGFGVAGSCCRICTMGPCRISPNPEKGAQFGVCGADANVIVSRNLARMIAAGAASHSDHARTICYDLYDTGEDKDLNIADVDKLLRTAPRFNVETEGRNTYDIAHDVAIAALSNYGSIFNKVDLPPSLSPLRLARWQKYGFVPKAIDKEIVSILHSTHIGCTADAEDMMKQAFRCAIGDGWLGSYMATEFSDIMFGTPVERSTEANLGVLEENQVNIVMHGHEPTLSEMIVRAADDPEIIALAKSVGAEGINICGVCCTANEASMRHGMKLAGNFLQQEMVIITGAVEAMIVDVQCIMPSLVKVASCYHTKFITTTPKAKIAGSLYMEMDEHNRLESAKNILREAINNYPKRDRSKVQIPNAKIGATLGYSVEEILNKLGKPITTLEDKITNVAPLVEVIANGTIKGVAAVVGCNNTRSKQDENHVKIIEELIAKDILVVATGCAAHAVAKAGLLRKDAKAKAGAGIQAICDLLDMPPVIHMGSCVDISRIMDLVGIIASHIGVDICELPVAGLAPEYMSEKALTIGMYVVATGIDTWLGSMPPIGASPQVVGVLTSTTEEWFGSRFFVEADPKATAEQIIARISEKREKLGLPK